MIYSKWTKFNIVSYYSDTRLAKAIDSKSTWSDRDYNGNYYYDNQHYYHGETRDKSRLEPALG